MGDNVSRAPIWRRWPWARVRLLVFYFLYFHRSISWTGEELVYQIYKWKLTVAHRETNCIIKHACLHVTPISLTYTDCDFQVTIRYISSAHSEGQNVDNAGMYGMYLSYYIRWTVRRESWPLKNGTAICWHTLKWIHFVVRVLTKYTYSLRQAMNTWAQVSIILCVHAYRCAWCSDPARVCANP